MRDDIAAAIAKIDSQISPEMVAASQEIYQPWHEREPYRDITVTRDQKYGPASRHRLDVFAPAAIGSEKRPVVIYVHGGGFIGGDKVLAGTAYYDNVGVWAVRNGYVGVTMTYPLAPEGKYPEGAASVGQAVGWVLNHIGKYGGDPYSVIVFGQSAGATHVATYVGRPELHASPGGGVRGAVLLSGVYDFTGGKIMPNTLAYIGDAPDAAEKASALPAMAKTQIPLLFGVSESDPPMFHASAKKLIDALYAETGKIPNVMYFPRHNHISQIAHLNASGTEDNLLADRLREFINVNTARALTAT